MRRILALIFLTPAAAVLFVAGTAAGGEDGTYQVRAIFDNAAFLVEGEEVRVAGARVGAVKEVGVSNAEEIVRADGTAEPGKAVVVLEIDDPGFQDFRDDASCLIRPQSLIGEKFVECEPTQPRAAASPLPPPLEAIPDGEPGAGQLLLPLEQNGKAVDLDLLNNIQEEPYPDRFRLILNDLGAGLAARGEELAEIVERSNPALRETNRVLAILARQNRTLSDLARDGDAIVTALARERDSVAGFINSAAVAGQATAERREDLEQSFAKLPGFLRELRTTMTELESFSDSASPVFSELGAAAPSLTRINRALGPFSNAGTGAFVSLGEASEESAPPLVASDPVIRQIGALAREGSPATRNLAKLLATFRKTDGFQYLFETIFGAGGAVNAFDSYGHFLRALIPVNNCFDYTSVIQSGCDATFASTIARANAPATGRRSGGAKDEPQPRRAADAGGDVGRDRDGGPSAPEPPLDFELDGSATPEFDDDTSELPPPSLTPEPAPPASDAASAGPSRGELRATRELLDFLIGRRATRSGKR